MKSISIHIMLLFLILLKSSNLLGQNHTIEGAVYDAEEHTALAGATIITADSSDYAATDLDGHFTMTTSKQKGVLRISYIGYKTENVHFDSRSSTPLSISLTPDAQSLNEVVISAFSIRKSIQETAGSIAYLPGTQLKEGNGTSIQMAVNRIPGVRMDQSTLGDSRISIRGNGVRSPWGLRNVKVYINGIPLTETDGTTRIEALDIPSLGSAEIIKGPASSIYGAGIGGVMKFQLEHAPYDQQSIEGAGLIGSYGLQREAFTYRGGSDKFNGYVSYGDQYSSGYRTHSHDKRRFLTGNFQFFPSDNRTLTLLISRTTQKTQIPGALTKAQVEQDRKQAAPENLEKEAGRIQTWTRVGIAQKYKFNENLTNTTSGFTYFYDLHHPLVFGIIRNYYQSYGGRTKFDYDPHFKILPTTFTLGGEFNQAKTKGSIYVNNQGEEGALFSNTDYKNSMATLFFQSETKIGNIANLVFGLSYNQTKYDVTDYLTPKAGGIKKFNEATPRVALSHDFGDWLTLHGSMSFGFSAPTTDQIQNEDQSLNKSIRAVKGTNYEINAKGNLFHSDLSYHLSLYEMRMKGELIEQTLSPGVTVYHNSGKTNHEGMELALSYRAINAATAKIFTTLNPYLSVSYSNFKIKQYDVLDADNQVIHDYSGNKLIGVAPWTVSAGVYWDTEIGIYGNANYYFSDDYPLNDANTDYNKAYTVLNAKLGYQRDLGQHFNLNLFAGIKNITNTKYSSFTALNAIAENGATPAYFSPSPKRNFYVGLNLNYKFQ